MPLMGSGMVQMSQMYVVAMQIWVPRSSLGIATASIQFSRTIGSMFGAAIFGAILTRRLASELTSRLGEAAQQVSPGALLSGTMRVADVPPQTAEAGSASLASAPPTPFPGGLSPLRFGPLPRPTFEELPP